jgi:hypothetical protein
MRAAAQGDYSFCYGRIHIDRPAANDIRYTCSIPRSFMVYTKRACSAMNSAVCFIVPRKEESKRALARVGLVERHRWRGENGESACRLYRGKFPDN